MLIHYQMLPFSGTVKVLNVTQFTTYRQLFLTEITNNISEH
jgi:hypothetical protein